MFVVDATDEEEPSWTAPSQHGFHSRHLCHVARVVPAVARAQEGLNWHVHGSRRDCAGKMTALGSFSTAAKAALCYAQQCAAKKAEAPKASAPRALVVFKSCKRSATWPLCPCINQKHFNTLLGAARLQIPNLNPPLPPSSPFACVTAQYRSPQRPDARPLWLPILGIDGASTA